MFPLEGKCTNVVEARNEKVEHCIRIKTHKPIVLRFWVESGVNNLCNWAKVLLIISMKPHSL